MSNQSFKMMITELSVVCQQLIKSVAECTCSSFLYSTFYGYRVCRYMDYNKLLQPELIKSKP